MLDFVKMNGLGNDYIFIDITKEIPEYDFSNLAKILSNRHTGIGSDGLILIASSEIADFKMIMYNQDGSEGKMCGNGIRCVAKYVYEKELTTKDILTIETLSGIKKVTLEIENGMVTSIEVDMGAPIFEIDNIPVIAKTEPVKNLKINANDKVFFMDVLSMGNPHAVTVVKHLDDFDVKKYGSVIEKDFHFPERTNVEFVEVIDPYHIKMRVWERGSGETMACGTGACASVVACYFDKLTSNSVNVKLKGGTLSIRMDEQTQHVYMKGPAAINFYGSINLDQ